MDTYLLQCVYRTSENAILSNEQHQNQQQNKGLSRNSITCDSRSSDQFRTTKIYAVETQRLLQCFYRTTEKCDTQYWTTPKSTPEKGVE